MGVDKDERKAAELIEKAAVAGDAISQYNLALIYRDSETDFQDNEAAVEWLRKSSDSGFSHAQADLAICLIQGKGCETNLIEALKLCILAENTGLERAAEVRKYLESEMDSNDIEAARKAATKN